MSIKFKRAPNAVIVKIDGEIDAETAREMRRSIDVEYDEVGARDLIFDMKDVTFMDSSGIGMIIGRFKRVSAIGGSVKIVGADKNVRRIIELSGLGRIVKVENTKEEGRLA
jgi:stage II sporulation protein AA (anti-sigma F factor antagonist)